ncbi:tRNA pseudouridine synthase A [bacterium]|nr:tRNA pseudouridine synthase A [bacterium]
MNQFRYCLVLEFNGSDFCGWQKQSSFQEDEQKPSIQNVLLSALQTITRQDVVSVTGCGRTDAGVHAQAYFAHFDLSQKLEEPRRIRLGLDAVLPNSIGVLDLREVSSSFHALESVKTKTYEYTVLLRRGKDALGLSKRWWIPIESEPSSDQFDFDVLNDALRQLEGSHDFVGFAASGYGAKTTKRTLHSATVRRVPQGMLPSQGTELIFTFTGDGFLRHQVRNMVGTLVRMAQGQLEANFVEVLLKTPQRPENRVQGLHCAPGFGLSLKEVVYEE